MLIAEIFNCLPAVFESLVPFLASISLISKDASYGAGGHLCGIDVIHIAILPSFNESSFSLNFGTWSASYRLKPPFFKNPQQNTT
jgi:hypothetical protein